MRKPTHNYISSASTEYIENYSYMYNKDNSQDSIFVLRMPVIIQSDNTVWELASLYLQHLLINKSAAQKTLESAAYSLLDFLKFMEHTGLDILHLPYEQHERVTYRYKASLLQRVRQSLLMPSTANAKMNRVLKFYEFCIVNQLFTKESLHNTPYSVIKHRITLHSDYGHKYQKTVISSDLAIKLSKRQVSADAIVDGGELHPLNDNEQNFVKEYLNNTATREFQLMCYIALYSGARIQTICTLRVFNIINLKAINPDPFDDSYAIKVGSNTLVDTKNGTQLIIKIPRWLVDDLISYSKSTAWKKRAKLSFYGLSDQNYLFLTARGRSYYTSLKEIEDRRNSGSLLGFKESRGLSVRIHINQMLKKLNEREVKVNPFTFHDLRATFGINTIKLMIKHGFEHDQALLYLKDRLGHRNIKTTIGYLEHAGFTSNIINANTTFSEVLNQYSSSR